MQPVQKYHRDILFDLEEKSQRIETELTSPHTATHMTRRSDVQDMSHQNPGPSHPTATKLTDPHPRTQRNPFLTDKFRHYGRARLVESSSTHGMDGLHLTDSTASRIRVCGRCAHSQRTPTCRLLATTTRLGAQSLFSRRSRDHACWYWDENQAGGPGGAGAGRFVETCQMHSDQAVGRALGTQCTGHAGVGALRLEGGDMREA
jgi:hypothetical protein